MESIVDLTSSPVSSPVTEDRAPNSAEPATGASWGALGSADKAKEEKGVTTTEETGTERSVSWQVGAYPPWSTHAGPSHEIVVCFVLACIPRAPLTFLLIVRRILLGSKIDAARSSVL